MANPTIIGGIFLLLSTLRTSFGFSFNTSTPTQCGPLTVQWDGGRPPFQLLIVPTFEIASGKIVNFTIPDSLSAPYSYTFDLEEPAGLEFLVTMYDSEGFGTGGTTGVLTVGSSDNTSCLDTNLLYDFTFQLSPVSDPPQCSSQTITWPNNVTRPINLFGLIPGGTAWQIPIPQDGTSYDWQVNIDDGTEYLLVMSDTGPYITGGSSNLIRVASGSEGCMNSTSPRAGSAGSTPTTSGSNPSSSVSGVGGSSNGGQANENTGTTGQSNGGGGSSTPIGAIVGGTVGGVAFIVLLLLLLFCFCRRRARPRRDSADPMIKSYGVNGEPVIEKRRSGMVDLLTGNRPQRQFSDDSQNNETREGGQEYQPSPFTYPDSTQAAAMTGATAARQGGRPGEAGAVAGAGTGVGALGATGQRRNHTGEKEQLPPSLAADTHTRQSTDTQSTQPTTPINPHSNLAPSEISTSNDNGTDMATLGHVGQGQGVNRNSSISKPAHTSTPNDGTRPLPNAPAAGGQRFVQHEDSGEVVDLPPRYDQLRTRNPDP